MFGRGAGGVGRTFDARQKIGMTDVRQRLGGGGGTGNQQDLAFRSGIGMVSCLLLTLVLLSLPPAFQVKDAREKLGQKDARFRIRGGAGGVQDARQMINSRKGGPNTFNVTPQSLQQIPAAQLQTHVHANARAGVTPQLGGAPKRMMDARDRLSLKRTIGAPPSQGMVTPMKITKTIQVSDQADSWLQSDSNHRSRICSNMSIFLFLQQPGTLGCPFTMSAPITKVVKNDAYTAPRPPVPVAPTRPNPSVGASRSSALALQPISRTLRQCFGAPLQPTFSPLEGTKITVNNLHPRVTEEDIVELFCVCGALKRARLVKVGIAEVVFVRKEDAVSAYRKYNNRCLDGQPMKCNLHIQGNVITSDQPILLRLSDTPGTGRKEGLPLSLSRPGGQPASSQPTPEVDPQTILKALFKSTVQTPSTTESPGSQCTAFRIKI
uniref:Polymerase (DNA-directed), delta interacting protein 3 n=1 Tax=Oncorhynchus mykiss TaxID=8022 RepID=A0A8C7PVH4_ONCMY